MHAAAYKLLPSRNREVFEKPPGPFECRLGVFVERPVSLAWCMRSQQGAPGDWEKDQATSRQLPLGARRRLRLYTFKQVELEARRFVKSQIWSKENDVAESNHRAFTRQNHQNHINHIYTHLRAGWACEVVQLLVFHLTWTPGATSHLRPCGSSASGACRLQRHMRRGDGPPSRDLGRLLVLPLSDLRGIPDDRSTKSCWMGE